METGTEKKTQGDYLTACWGGVKEGKWKNWKKEGEGEFYCCHKKCNLATLTQKRHKVNRFYNRSEVSLQVSLQIAGAKGAHCLVSASRAHGE